ncbi:Hsp20/alpha crystallin family protein [Candidatus Hodarchaeum mangrovi]
MRDKERFKDKDRDFGFYFDFSPFNELFKLHPQFWRKRGKNFQCRPCFDHTLRGKQYPRTSIEKDNEKYTLVIELPGITKDDINLELTSEEVWLEAKNEEYEKHYFYRNFFESPIIPEQAQAKLKMGILTLHLPLKEGESKVKVDIE